MNLFGIFKKGTSENKQILDNADFNINYFEKRTTFLNQAIESLISNFRIYQEESIANYYQEKLSSYKSNFEEGIKKVKLEYNQNPLVLECEQYVFQKYCENLERLYDELKVKILIIDIKKLSDTLDSKKSKETNGEILRIKQHYRLNINAFKDEEKTNIIKNLYELIFTIIKNELKESSKRINYERSLLYEQLDEQDKIYITQLFLRMISENLSNNFDLQKKYINEINDSEKKIINLKLLRDYLVEVGLVPRTFDEVIKKQEREYKEDTRRSMENYERIKEEIIERRLREQVMVENKRYEAQGNTIIEISDNTSSSISEKADINKTM